MCPHPRARSRQHQATAPTGLLHPLTTSTSASAISSATSGRRRSSSWPCTTPASSASSGGVPGHKTPARAVLGACPAAPRGIAHPAQPRSSQRVSQGEGARLSPEGFSRAGRFVMACQPCSHVPWDSPWLVLPQALVRLPVRWPGWASACAATGDAGGAVGAARGSAIPVPISTITRPAARTT